MTAIERSLSSGETGEAGNPGIVVERTFLQDVRLGFMATNKKRKAGEGKPVQGRQGGGGQQAGGNKLRAKTGTAGGQKQKHQSREVGRTGGGRG